MIKTHGAKLARLARSGKFFPNRTAHLLQAGGQLSLGGMASLFHQPICPFSRKVRLVLGEKKFAVEFVEERPWERRLDFLMLNPSGEVPVLVGDAGTIAGHYAITEWLEEKGGALPLMPSGGLPAPRCAA